MNMIDCPVQLPGTKHPQQGAIRKLGFHSDFIRIFFFSKGTILTNVAHVHARAHALGAWEIVLLEAHFRGNAIQF